MTAPQMDFLGALLKAWTRKIRVFADPPAEGEHGATFPLVVDLAKSIGARPLHADDRQPSHRVLDVEGLSRSIRRRI